MENFIFCAVLLVERKSTVSYREGGTSYGTSYSISAYRINNFSLNINTCTDYARLITIKVCQKSLINISIIICKIAVNGKKEIENSRQFF